MGGSGCTCGLLPCICVGSADDITEFAPAALDAHSSTADGMVSAKAKLRQLFASNATQQCMSCMMMPCICPADDDAVLMGDDETTSVEAASPLASDHEHAAEDEEMDEYGRVRLVSRAAHSQEKEEDAVWIAREIKPLLKPHQLEGVQFLHAHVAAQRGCILADYMGLGKTLQVITVIYSFLVDELDARRQRHRDHEDQDTHTQNKRLQQLQAQKDTNKQEEDDEPRATVLVLCPAICLPNWEAEFQKWLSVESRARCPVLTLDATTTKGTTAGRLRLLQRWKRTGGVLLMGYEMFRGLLNPTTAPVSSAAECDASIQVCSRMTSATLEVTSASAQATAKVQREAREFRRLLCAPGADLVVLDEGHRMKDPSSLLCQSVAQIRSPRRLVLTGYPVQNSLSEYWCMVNFAREGFLGSYDAFRAKYERPILEGNATRSQELITRLQSVVLRRGKALLRSQLPPKMEWILYCKLSPVQHRLYCDFLDFYGEGGSARGANADLLTAYAALLQVMNHPDIIYSKLCPSQADGSALLPRDDEGDSSDALSAQDEESGWAWESEERLQQKRQLAATQRRKKRQKISDRQKSYEWARSVIFNEAGAEGELGRAANNIGAPISLAQAAADTYRTEVLENSGKMAVLLRIVEESFACDDKVVVFSQSVPTLKAIAAFLRASAFSPSRAADDAAAAKRTRSTSAHAVNKPKRRRIAARPNRDPAGILRKRRSQSSGTGSGVRKGSGGSTAASSVDSTEWFLQIDGSTNGAKRMEYIKAKTVHVYRLVSTGTMERMIYEQQMKKVDLSTSVVDSQEKAQSDVKGGSSRDAIKPADTSLATTTGATAEDLAGLVPFSGFLQPPIEPDYKKQLVVDEAIIEGDEPVHELQDEEKQQP
ncbi:hypothetical protein BBJ28_00017315 [Nothophytophthora sp. Chile5]|nr:hypothetical protein BBJ28_00017315 [Nothophytophthora sp. Chile5]